MDGHHVAGFIVRALHNVRAPFRHPQGSTQRNGGRSEPLPRRGDAPSNSRGASFRSGASNTTSKPRLPDYRTQDSIEVYQHELERLKTSNGKLKRQLEQQELEERIKTEKLRIWQVLAIKELETHFRDRAPLQPHVVTNSETCQDATYTAGAPRILSASDGAKQCLALFLTDSLVNSMRQVIEESRELEMVEGPYETAKREADIGRANVEYAKAMLETADTQEQINYFRGNLEENGSQLLRDIQRKDELEDDVQLRRLKFEHSQAGLQRMLEQVLTEAHLFAEAQDTGHNIAQSFPDRASERTQSEVGFEHEETFLDPVDEARRLAKQDLDAANENLYYAQEHFDTQPGRQRQDIEEYRQQGGENWFEFPESDLDIEHLRQRIEATRALVEAEEGLDLAEARARAVGVIGNLPHQRSHFCDMEEDGHVESEDPSEEPTVNVDSIRAWTEGVWDAHDTEDMDAEMDDWDKRTVGLGDSLSVVDDHQGNRKAIDRWRFACDRAAEGEMGGDPSAIILDGQLA